MSTGRRRLFTSQRVARSTSVRTSIRSPVCTAASTWWSSAWIRPSRSSAPKMARAAMWARITSGAPAPVSPDSRWKQLIPAALTNRLTTTVPMISRRSRCSAIRSA